MGTAPDSELPSRFEDLWEEWRPRAAAYTRSFSGLSFEEREDLASEAVMRAWRYRDSYKPGMDFAPWFFTIVRREAMNAIARKPREGEAPLPLETLRSAAEGPEGLALKTEEEAFVRRFLAARDDTDRELSSLIYGGGLSQKAAASVVGIPSGTAKWRLFEMRKALKRAWEGEYGQSSEL